MSTYQDEKKYSSLARILKDEDYAIIDTCSLMEDSFPEFLDILEETKQEYLEPSFPVYVLESSIEELKRHAGNKEQKEKRIAATQAIRILSRAKRKKTIDIIRAVAGGREEKKSKDKNEEDYYFADVEIISKVTLDRTKYNVVIITQDKKLASDLLSLNSSQAVHGSKVHVYKIEPNATLAENKGEERLPAAKKGSKKAGASVLLKETLKQKPAPNKPQPEPKQPSSRPSRKIDPAELINKVVAMDKRIHANLSNPNYTKDKMLADLKTQLSDIQKIPSEKQPSLRISHNVESLQLEVRKIEHPELFMPPAVPAAKPIEPTKLSKAAKKEAKGALWYEYGQTVEEAFRNVGNHYGIFFRDPSVPYVPGIHGPVNFTTEDLSKISATYGNTLKEGQKIIKQYRSVYLMAERTQKGIKAWIDLNGILAAQLAPQEKEEPSKEKAKQKQRKNEIEKPVLAQNEQPAANEPSKKPAEQPKKSKKKKAEKPADSAEKPSKDAQNAANVTSDEVLEEVFIKRTDPKASAAVKNASKPKKKTHLQETIECDAKLKANINNPNYPKEQKIQDVEDQILRVKKTPLKDRGDLNFDLNALKTFLSILG